MHRIEFNLSALKYNYTSSFSHPVGKNHSVWDNTQISFKMEAVGSLLCHGHISSWLCSCVDKMLDWPHQSLHVCVSIALIQWIPLRAKSLSKYLATSNFSLQTPTQSQVFTPTLSYWALQLPNNYLSFSLEGWRNSEWMMYSFIMCWIVNRGYRAPIYCLVEFNVLAHTEWVKLLCVYIFELYIIAFVEFTKWD